MISFKKSKLTLTTSPYYVESVNNVEYIELIRVNRSNSLIAVIYPGRDFKDDLFEDAISSFQKRYETLLSKYQISNIKQWCIKNNVCDFYAFLPEEDIISRTPILLEPINKLLKL